MRNGLIQKIFGLGFSFVLLCTAVACGDNADPSGDLMKDFVRGTYSGVSSEDLPNPEEPSAGVSGGEEYFFEDGAVAVTDFGVRLFQQSFEQENTLVSPLSVISALSMTANGAKEETLEQIEAVFGMSVSEMSVYLHDYREALPLADKYKLSLANAIWFKDDPTFTVEQNFLQTNADYFDAGLYKAPFDESTKDEINSWVEKNTDGMIRDILDEIPDAAVMYLVNALAFDAEWQNIYNENQVRDGEFTKEDGTVQKAELMYSKENQYLEDEQAEGFLKYYADKKYAFAALLPKEGVTISEYVDSLTGEKLRELLTNPVTVQVNAAIPKYESEYSVQMSRILSEMGMEKAFDALNADFSGIGHSSMGNIYINRVLHKTFIAVDEKGTKAGAATVVEMIAESAMIEPEEVKTVYLDRPFIYMIIDCESKLPVFIGAVTSLEK